MRIRFDPPPGLVSDDTTFAARGAWEDSSNIRFWRGGPQTIGGWVALAGERLPGRCRAVLPWTDLSGDLNIGFGTHSHLVVYAGGSLFDITPAGLAAGGIDGVGGPGYGAGAWDTGDYSAPHSDWFPRSWSLDNYGQALVASPRDGTIYLWENDTGTPAAALAGAPVRVNAMLVTPERQILALGCNEEASGAFNPLCIRGCDIEDPESWTSAPDNNAFEHVLKGGGRIVTARLFGPFVAVWTDNGVHLGQFVGDPGQAYRFDRVGENCGAVGPNAVTILGQTAYWIGPDLQFRRWPLGGAPEILACPIRNDFKDHLAEAQGDKIVAATLSQYGEVWFFYPDARDGAENSRYVVFAEAESARAGSGIWFRGRMARTAFCDAGVAGYPLGVAPDGQAHFHEIGASANGANLEWHVKSADFALDEAQRVMMWRGIWPDFETQAGAVDLTLYLRAYPQAEAVEKGPFTLDEEASKLDFRVTGRVAALKWSGASNPAFMRGGRSSLDVAVAGER